MTVADWPRSDRVKASTERTAVYDYIQLLLTLDSPRVLIEFLRRHGVEAGEDVLERVPPLVLANLPATIAEAVDVDWGIDRALQLSGVAIAAWFKHVPGLLSEAVDVVNEFCAAFYLGSQPGEPDPQLRKALVERMRKATASATERLAQKSERKDRDIKSSALLWRFVTERVHPGWTAINERRVQRPAAFAGGLPEDLIPENWSERDRALADTLLAELSQARLPTNRTGPRDLAAVHAAMITGLRKGRSLRYLIKRYQELTKDAEIQDEPVLREFYERVTTLPPV